LRKRSDAILAKVAQSHPYSFFPAYCGVWWLARSDRWLCLIVP